MKNRFLFIGGTTIFVLFSLLVSGNVVNATEIIDFPHEELAKRADLVLIGTVKSGWFDFRPFDEMPLVDTVKVRPDEWLKNNHGIDSEIEVRYYGKWAKIADDMGSSARGSAAFQPQFEIGEKVLLFLVKEKPDMYMGGGYYSIGFQGKYSISENDIAQNHISEKNIAMKKMRQIISEQMIQIQKDISSDQTLIERTTNSLTDTFLKKYADAKISVNRENNDLSVDYMTYLDSISDQEPIKADNLPFLLLKTHLDGNGMRDSYSLECWNGERSYVLEKPSRIRDSIENQSCKNTIS